jgi:hypothetical protein
MLEQYPKIKKILYYYPLFVFFGVGYFVYIKVHDPSLFEFLVTVSFWISLPITFYTCRFVNNLEIIEKIKYLLVFSKVINLEANSALIKTMINVLTDNNANPVLLFFKDFIISKWCLV